MAIRSFDSTVGRLLKQKVELHIQQIATNLAYGSAMMATPESTGQKYSEELGYVRALNDALAFVAEIEDELQGRGQKQSGVAAA